MKLLNRTFTYSVGLVLIGALMTLPGCGGGLATDYASIGLVPVTGTVTLDGQPLEGATVFFESPDQTRSYATTDSSGKYQMMFNSEQAGVSPGEKTVRISTTASTGEEEIIEEDELNPRAAKTNSGPVDRVPAAYHRDSKIVVNVSADNATFDFALTSKGSMPVN